jgi:hypothetical protein
VKIQDGEAKLDPEDAKRRSRAETRDALAGDVLEGAGLEDLVDPALDLGAVAVEGRILES